MMCFPLSHKIPLSLLVTSDTSSGKSQMSLWILLINISDGGGADGSGSCGVGDYGDGRMNTYLSYACEYGLFSFNKPWIIYKKSRW